MLPLIQLGPLGLLAGGRVVVAQMLVVRGGRRRRRRRDDVHEVVEQAREDDEVGADEAGADFGDGPHGGLGVRVGVVVRVAEVVVEDDAADGRDAGSVVSVSQAVMASAELPDEEMFGGRGWGWGWGRAHKPPVPKTMEMPIFRRMDICRFQTR